VSEETLTVFVTKYALTDGIQEKQVTLNESFPNMVTGSGMFEHYHGEGKNWHRTRVGAIKRAEDMRVKKIESLQKSIKKMEQMRFS
jgi:hypothetical protein